MFKLKKITVDLLVSLSGFLTLSGVFAQIDAADQAVAKGQVIEKMLQKQENEKDPSKLTEPNPYLAKYDTKKVAPAKVEVVEKTLGGKVFMIDTLLLDPTYVPDADKDRLFSKYLNQPTTLSDIKTMQNELMDYLKSKNIVVKVSYYLESKPKNLNVRSLQFRFLKQ